MFNLIHILTVDAVSGRFYCLLKDYQATGEKLTI